MAMTEMLPLTEPISEHCKTGSFTCTADTLATIDVGFRPRKIYCYKILASGTTVSDGTWAVTYDEDISSSYAYRYGKSSGTNQLNAYDFPPSSGTNSIQEITATGFTYKANSTFAGTYNYIAVG